MGSSTRRTEAVLDELIEAGILEASGPETITRTKQFGDAVDDFQRRLASGDTEYKGSDVFGCVEVPVDHWDELTATALAVESFMTDLEKERIANIAISLQRFESPVRTNEIPDRFTGLMPMEIGGFCSQHPCSVVVFWKVDSDASQIVFSDFVDITDDPAFEDVGLGAVHAPDYPETAREQYAIGIVPTAIFFVDTKIDSRLVGPHHRQTFEREISVVVERAATADGV